MKVIVFGAGGAMGKIVCQVATAHGYEVVAKVDSAFETEGDRYASIFDFTGKADVIIDFSYHGAISDIASYAVKTNTPAIIATTGHTEEEKEIIYSASKSVPVFYAGNYSVGIALLCDLTRKAVEVMDGADVEIVEVHHNRKLDAPSGTALMLFNAVKEAKPEAEAVVGRSGQAKRKPEDVGISSLRMGNVVGIHEVHISTNTQTITLKHEAHDRALFAEGAVKAVEYLTARAAGLYSMKDMLSSK